MGDDRFASLPAPPYYTVIFSSRRADDDGADYAAMSERMTALAAEQPGFLGIEHARDPDGFGLTVSYWRSEADIRAWKRHAEHAVAQAQGRRDWYRHFEVRVARVERAYSGPPSTATEADR
jgi:heme-degrading monooxygenase HmoA